MPTMPIVVKVLVVAAVVVVAGFAFMYVLTLGEVGGRRVPSVAVSEKNLTGGVVFTFLAVASDVWWADLEIHISDGLHMDHWSLSAEDFVQEGGYATAILGDLALGTRTLTCENRDLSANDRINSGDDFRICGTHDIYIVTVVHLPSEGEMYQDGFTIPPSLTG